MYESALLSEHIWRIRKSIALFSKRKTACIRVLSSFYKDWKLQDWIALWTVDCMGSTAIVIYCECKIVQFFRVTNVTNDRTKRLYKEFHRALLAMVTGSVSHPPC